MKERTKGRIMIIVGCYLAILNPISSVSYSIFGIGAFAPYDPLSLLIRWLLIGGILAIILAVIGIYLIKYGYEAIKESKEDLH